MERRAALSGIAVFAAVVPLFCAPCGAQECRDQVVIILDASGSMASSMGKTKTQKMAAAKSALKEVLTSIPESTCIGLLVFSGKNVSDKWLYPLGPRDNAALMAAIDRPSPGGNTPLGQYIKIGADRLLEERATQLGYGSYRLLIVTDGEATDGALTDNYTPLILARGITMDSTGLHMKQAHTLATKANSYRSAGDPASLKKALTEILAEVPASGGDTAGDAAFAALAPLPAELCAAMVEALSKQNNVPIGEQAPAKAPDPKAAQSPASAPQTPAPPAALPTLAHKKRVPPAEPQNNPAPPTSRGPSWTTIIVFIMMVSGILTAKGSRNRRH